MFPKVRSCKSKKNNDCKTFPIASSCNSITPRSDMCFSSAARHLSGKKKRQSNLLFYPFSPPPSPWLRTYLTEDWTCQARCCFLYPMYLFAIIDVGNTIVPFSVLLSFAIRQLCPRKQLTHARRNAPVLTVNGYFCIYCSTWHSVET